MNHFKNFLIGILLISLPIVSLGCTKDIPADEAALIFFKIICTGDLSESNKVSISEEDKKTIKNGFEKANFNAMGVKITEEEEAKFEKAFMDIAKKCTTRAEIVSESKDSADVKLYVKGINLKPVISTAISNMSTEDFSDLDTMNLSLARNLIDELDKLALLDTERTTTIKLKKTSDGWTLDSNKETQKISDTIYGFDELEQLMEDEFEKKASSFFD